MEVSYKKLWKILIDKDMKKKDLQAAAGISWTQSYPRAKLLAWKSLLRFAEH